MHTSVNAQNIAQLFRLICLHGGVAVGRQANWPTGNWPTKLVDKDNWPTVNWPTKFADKNIF